VPVFSNTYMSSGGQPAVTHDTTVCCSRFQFRVNPMNKGVFSGTCVFGWTIQGGMGGRSAVECAAAASGKLSITGIGGGGSGL